MGCLGGGGDDSIILPNDFHAWLTPLTAFVFFVIVRVDCHESVMMCNMWCICFQFVIHDASHALVLRLTKRVDNICFPMSDVYALGVCGPRLTGETVYRSLFAKR